MKTSAVEQNFDVAIVGGGPAGSTAGGLLRKYAPQCSVTILEKARFPRPHVGESQLPPIAGILDEMGVWEKVEAAEFPIKVGASYTWGQSDEHWNYDFISIEDWVDEPRPSKFEGLRRNTAFQVDREIYDNILLRHAESMGCEVREQTGVSGVEHDGDRVTGLTLDDGSVVRAKQYIDASGAVGLFRKAMGIGTWQPEELRSIGLWRYWENAEWAVEIGVGATRVQVRSLPYGWIWFIPMGPTRTSIGLICPADYYKESGLSPEALYDKAVHDQQDIAPLIAEATPVSALESAKDWSYVADRLAGENWLLAGESAGFADPILAAGMTMAHTSGRAAAYLCKAALEGAEYADWMREWYGRDYRTKIRNHIRFAQYWYAGNGRFTDLQDHCSRIAKEAGLKLDAKQAWRWLAQGGFLAETPGQAGFGGYAAAAIGKVHEYLRGQAPKNAAEGFSEFRLHKHGVEIELTPSLDNGEVFKVETMVKGEQRVELIGTTRLLVSALWDHTAWPDIEAAFFNEIAQEQGGLSKEAHYLRMVWVLDALIREHWVTPKKNNKLRAMSFGSETSIRTASEFAEAIQEADADLTYLERV